MRLVTSQGRLPYRVPRLELANGGGGGVGFDLEGSVVDAVVVQLLQTF
jgi:hypothetical protein